MFEFFRYMFLPQGQPWYTGAFWSNQTQWTIVTLPSLAVLLWRMEKHHNAAERHRRKIERHLGINKTYNKEDNKTL